MNAQFDDRQSDTRRKLLARSAELRDRLERVRSDLRRQREPLPRDSDEAALVMENDEVLQAIEDTASSELRRIGHALDRIAQGTFARCEKCGTVIDAERLQAVPYATHCLACAREAG